MIVEASIVDGKLYLKTKDASEFIKASPQTLTGWKKKGLQDYSEDTIFENGKSRGRCFDVIELYNFEAISINKKFSNRDEDKTSSEFQYENIKLANGMKLSEIDVNNRFHIELATQHPLGQPYLDNVKTSIDIEKNKHSLEVKKKEYIYTIELDDITSELMAIVTNNTIAIRDILPIRQIEELIVEGIIKKEDKIKAQQILSKTADKNFEEMFTDIDNKFFKSNISGDKDEEDIEMREKQISWLESFTNKIKGLL